MRRVYQEYADRGREAHEWAPDHPGNRALVVQRTRVLGRLLGQSGRLPLGDRRVLDLGCGDGTVLAGLVHWGGAPGSSGRGRSAARCGAAARVRVRRDYASTSATPRRCPIATAASTSRLAFTVFTSILDDRVARQVAAEVGRVLRPGGALVWYDFRVDNPRNPHVRGMPRRRLAGLFPGWHARLQLVTLLPPLARRLGILTPVLYPVLATLRPAAHALARTAGEAAMTQEGPLVSVVVPARDEEGFLDRCLASIVGAALAARTARGDRGRERVARRTRAVAAARPPATRAS